MSESGISRCTGPGTFATAGMLVCPGTCARGGCAVCCALNAGQWRAAHLHGRHAGGRHAMEVGGGQVHRLVARHPHGLHKLAVRAHDAHVVQHLRLVCAQGSDLASRGSWQHTASRLLRQKGHMTRLADGSAANCARPCWPWQVAMQQLVPCGQGAHLHLHRDGHALGALQAPVAFWGAHAGWRRAH